MLKLKSQGGSLENHQWTMLKLKVQVTQTSKNCPDNDRDEFATYLLSAEAKHKK